jgi:hypothetical protein
VTIVSAKNQPCLTPPSALVPCSGDTLVLILPKTTILAENSGQNLDGAGSFQPRVACATELTHPAGS